MYIKLYIEGEAHNGYKAIALKLLIISKNVSGKSFSVREGRHTGPPYFFIGGGAEAMSRSTPLFQMEPCIFFFDDIITDFKTNSATYNTRSFYSLNLNQSNFQWLNQWFSFSLLNQLIFTDSSVKKIFFTVKSVNFHWNNQWNLTDLQ